MELRQMGVTKGRKMYLNIGEGKRKGVEPSGARWAGCTRIGTLNIQVNDKVAEFSLEFCSIHQKQTILRDMRVVGTILRYTYGACSVISWANPPHKAQRLMPR